MRPETDNQPHDRSIPELIRQITTDMSNLIHNEIALAKVELKQSAAAAGAGAAMFGAAAVFALFALGFLFAALAAGLIALGLPAWASILIVTVLLFIGAAVFAMIGKKKVAKVSVTPTLTMDNVRQDVATIKAEVQHVKVRSRS